MPPRRAKPAPRSSPSRLAGTRRAAERDASAALAAALDPIITINASGIIESASDSVRRVFGWTPVELIGRNVSVLMPEPHASAHDGYLGRYARTGKTHVLNAARRFDAQRKDGSVFPIELTVSRADVVNRSTPLFVGIIRDLSDRARSPDSVRPLAPGRDDDHGHLLNFVTEQTAALEAAHLRLRMADRMASIGTLAAGLGHDMNNVLLPVRARLNVLLAAYHPEPGEAPALSPPSPAAQREHVEAIAKSIAYLQELADGLHYLAQDPDDRQHDERATNLRAWWAQTGTIIAKAVPSHVRLTVSFPRSLPPVAVAPHRLTQAVLNLVVNAGEAIPALADDPTRKRRQGCVRVWARASDEVDTVHIGVTDNGAGMTPEVKRRAFELFFTTKVRERGTGLGLPLVYKVAARVGGGVEIDSEVGKGTTVTMSLPMARPARACDDQHVPVRATVTMADGRIASLVRHVLEAAGCVVTLSAEPAMTDLWLVEPSEKALRRARAWRSGKGERVRRGGRPLILLGRPHDTGPSGWAKAGGAGATSARLTWVDFEPHIIDDPSDFEAVRAAVGRAMADR
jgi:PAS domain S-box-containing protein